MRGGAFEKGSAAAQNLGQGLRYAERREDLPLAVTAGAAVRLGGSLLLSGELRGRPKAGEVSAGVGTEYGLLPAFVLRGGHRSVMGQSALGTSASPMEGLGLGLGVRVRKATVDYAITPQGELGQAQRLSVSTRF